MRIEIAVAEKDGKNHFEYNGEEGTYFFHEIPISRDMISIEILRDGAVFSKTDQVYTYQKEDVTVATGLNEIFKDKADHTNGSIRELKAALFQTGDIIRIDTFEDHNYLEDVLASQARYDARFQEPTPRVTLEPA